MAIHIFCKICSKCFSCFKLTLIASVLFWYVTKVDLDVASVCFEYSKLLQTNVANVFTKYFSCLRRMLWVFYMNIAKGTYKYYILYIYIFKCIQHMWQRCNRCWREDKTLEQEQSTMEETTLDYFQWIMKNRKTLFNT